jgi:hypothetical protein
MLDLSNTEVTDWSVGLKKLRQALPDCEMLVR